MTVSPVWKLLRESNNGAVGAAYHHNPRLDLLTLLDRQPRKVLDVGCATGATGQALRQRFPEVELWGVEQNAAAAKIAAQTYRTVFIDVFSHVDFATSGLMPESIDTVILADVLEHMADPWDTLQRLLPLLHPNAQLLVSLPNARNLWLLNELAEGRWTYEDQGIMDVTHLRFFTRAEGQRMLEETGYRVEGIAWGPDSRFLNAPVPQHFPTRIESEKIVLKDVTAADFQELVSLQIFFRAGLGTSLPKSHGDTHFISTSDAKNKNTTPNDPCHFSGPLRQSQTAVILHLFYAELWDEIADALFSLGEDFNLYVSVTESAESLVSKISQRVPSAQIFVRPNRGRDIAPRLALAKAAIAAGHEYLLFIHSKKSPHLRQMKPEQIHVDFLSHGDGDRWRRDLLDNLLAPSVVAHVRERFT
ncbi:MAG: class I SAM-dependent methyltransferase, partial [Acidithiobacillus sp.]